jgi:hypothetical protein
LYKVDFEIVQVFERSFWGKIPEKIAVWAKRKLEVGEGFQSGDRCQDDALNSSIQIPSGI